MHDTSCCFDSLSKFIVNGLWMWSTDKSESFEQININFVKCKLMVRIEKIGCLLLLVLFIILYQFFFFFFIKKNPWNGNNIK